MQNTKKLIPAISTEYKTALADDYGMTLETVNHLHQQLGPKTTAEALTDAVEQAADTRPIPPQTLTFMELIGVEICSC